MVPNGGSSLQKGLHFLPGLHLGGWVWLVSPVPTETSVVLLGSDKPSSVWGEPMLPRERECVR